MTSSGLAEAPALEVAVPRRKRTRRTQCRASRLHFVEHLFAAREPAKASSDMSVCFGAEGISSSGPAHEVIDLMVKDQRVDPDGEPPGNHWLRLILYVYAPILHVRAPGTLPASNPLGTSSKGHRLRG
jgi:hypothetical protein